MVPSAIGKIIKAALERLAQPQSWLAEQVGVSNYAVTKWIQTGKVSRQNAIKIADVLGIPLDELLGRARQDAHNEASEPRTPEGVRAGLRVRKCRESLGWTREQLERASGGRLSPSRIGNYENGLRELGIREAEILGEALGEPPAYLMGLVDEVDREFLHLAPRVRHDLLKHLESASRLGAMAQTHRAPTVLRSGQRTPLTRRKADVKKA